MIRIASRKSPLAIIQAKLVLSSLSQAKISNQLEIVPISTTIDSRLNSPLNQSSEVGLFTREIDMSLIDRTTDIAVHSSKDLPLKVSNGLIICSYLKRESAHDILISSVEKSKIKSIGTCSPRREYQLKNSFPNAIFKPIRGNVETRLKKVLDGYSDATILASAGLSRLGIMEYNGLHFTPITIKNMVPAAGQGAIALVCRKEDYENYKELGCHKTYEAVTIEKKCLELIDGGCQSPTGIHYDAKYLHIYHPSIGYKSHLIDAMNIEQKIKQCIIIINSYKSF